MKCESVLMRRDTRATLCTAGLHAVGSGWTHELRVTTPAQLNLWQGGRGFGEMCWGLSEWGGWDKLDTTHEHHVDTQLCECVQPENILQHRSTVNFTSTLTPTSGACLLQAMYREIEEN